MNARSTKTIENPSISTDDGIYSDGTKTVETHPAYAQIGASRVSGSTNLYGSDFSHNHYMIVTIRRSELHRNPNRDRYHANEELISVALSESQWASFVSRTNMGDGVPCTIDHIQGAKIPGLPNPINRADQFKAEMQGDMVEVASKIERTIKRIDEMGLSNGKSEELKNTFRSVLRDINDNMPFVAEKVKQEIHGYMTKATVLASLDALTPRSDAHSD